MSATDKFRHIDRNGVELRVGDVVRYGIGVGTVLILEDWDRLGGSSPWKKRAGVYVSGIGSWGDPKAVAADKVERLDGGK